MFKKNRITLLFSLMALSMAISGKINALEYKDLTKEDLQSFKILHFTENEVREAIKEENRQKTDDAIDRRCTRAQTARVNLRWLLRDKRMDTYSGPGITD